MRTILLALPLLLGACAAVTDPAAERYEGVYTSGFEVNGFQPCGSKDSWWVTEGDLHTRYKAVATQDYEPVYVEVAADVGPTGKFGHMGAYTREIAVKDVIVMRPLRDSDCK